MKKWLVMSCLAVCAVSAQATSLTQSVQKALDTHPDLIAGNAEVLANEFDVQAATQAFRPRLDLNAGIGRERTDADNVNGGDPLTLTRRELGLTATWTLFDAGAAGEVSRRDGISESARFGFMDLRQRVALDAAQAYINLWRAEQQYRIVQGSRMAHETLVDQIGRRVEQGVSNDSELIQAQGRLALALSNQTAALSNLQIARATYHRMVGEIPNLDLSMPRMQWKRPSNLDQAVDLAYANHPVIAQAKADIAQAMGQAKTAEGRLLPTLRLEVGASRNEDLDGIRGVSTDRQAVLRANWALYNGAERSNVRASAQRVAQAESLLNDAQREVIEATHQAWNEFQSTAQQLDYLVLYVASANSTREAYQQQFTINRRTLLEVLDSEVERFEALASQIDVQADHVIADLQLAASQGQLLKVMQEQAN